MRDATNTHLHQRHHARHHSCFTHAESWQSADVVLYNYITQFTDEQLLHAIVYRLPSRAIPPPTPATSHKLVCGTDSKAALPAEAPSVDWWIVWRRTLHSSRHVRCTSDCQLR
jgi:hypothetical protein